MDPNNKAFCCPLCERLLKTAETLRRHFQGCCEQNHPKQIVHPSTDIDMESDNAPTLNPCTPARSHPVIDRSVTSPRSNQTKPPGSENAQDLPSDICATPKPVKSRIPTIADIGNPDFHQTKLMILFSPYLAIHRPTGFLYCSEDRHLSELSRMFRHFQLSHRKTLPKKLKLDILQAIANLDLPPQAAEEYFLSMRYRSGIEGLSVYDGFECGDQDCTKVLATKRDFHRHFENDHGSVKFAISGCSFQYVFFPIREGGVRLYKVPDGPTQINLDEGDLPTLPGFDEMFETMNERFVFII